MGKKFIPKFVMMGLLMLCALHGCNKNENAVTQVPELHLHTSYEVTGYHLRDADTSPIAMYVGIYSSEADFWKKRWDITIESEYDLSITSLYGTGNVVCTYPIDNENMYTWINASLALQAKKYDYSELYYFGVSIPDAEGLFPFRLKFKNVDTGEEVYSSIETIKSTRCQDKSCLFVGHKIIELERD